MAFDSLPDLRAMMMLEGKVYAAWPSGTAVPALELCAGAARSLFLPCPDDPLLGLGPRDRLPLVCDQIARALRSDPAEETPGEVFACWVNHLPDWTLQDSQTIQLMINRAEAPCQIDFQRGIEVPRLRRGMFFQARLALHRAEADLLVRMRDPITGVEHRRRVGFDPAATGGQNPEGYALVTLPLPEDFQSCRIELSVAFKKHCPDDSGNNPFLFLADLAVLDPNARSGPTPVVQPRWIIGGPQTEAHQWLCAPLPAPVGPGTQLQVMMGADTLPLPPAPKPPFQVTENYGHTLICETEEPLDLVLCVDGGAPHPIRLGRNERILRLPGKYLDGQPHHIAIKDRSATLTHFQCQQLTPAIVTPADVMQTESAAPFPGSLFAQSGHRYESLRRLIADPPADLDLGQLHHALATLEGGPANVTLKPLHFDLPDAPDVSVVIPAHNQIAMTYLTLCSLLLAPNQARFEVILVDDGSTDETARIEHLVSGIRVQRFDRAQRFVGACNAGAALARGKYITLLNNDVEVTAGWLDALIDAFDRFDQVGLVGAKLLFPDGALQEAGGIVWNNGNPWNYGRGQNPHDPRFCYARQVDYLSGAAMMTPAKLWRQLGGLSGEMAPMYFEDTDFAFKLRDAGYSSWYVPASVVYHFEGMTAGSDVSSGFKKYQEVNRPKFKRRWAGAFAGFGKEGQTPDLEKDRGIAGRVLFIDYAPPRPDRDAGSYAAFEEMKLVQSLGFKVSFLPTNLAHLGSYTEMLQAAGIEAIYAPFFMNVEDYLARHAQDFDAFYITRYYVAQAVLPHLRSLAPQTKVIFNNADLHFLREMRTAQQQGDRAKLDRAQRTREDELEVIGQADVVLSYTEVEHSVIQSHSAVPVQVLKCPWITPLPGRIAPRAGRSGLSFLGSYRHHPNSEGICWFVSEILPLLETKGGPAHLKVYGADLHDEIRALAGAQVSVHGFIPDQAQAFDPHRIFVAPLLSGAGIKGKVVSALAHGIPSVLTPIAAEGIGLRAGHDCFIAETPEDWRQAVWELSADDALWQEMSDNARSYAQASFSASRGREMMRRALEAVDLYGSGR